MGQKTTVDVARKLDLVASGDGLRPRNLQNNVEYDRYLRFTAGIYYVAAKGSCLDPRE